MTIESELQAACAATRGMFGAAACSCALASRTGPSSSSWRPTARARRTSSGCASPVSRGIAGFVALSGQPIAIADVGERRALRPRHRRGDRVRPDGDPRGAAAGRRGRDHRRAGGARPVARPTTRARWAPSAATVAELAALTWSPPRSPSCALRLLEATTGLRTPTVAALSELAKTPTGAAGARGAGRVATYAQAPVSLPAWSEAFETTPADVPRCRCRAAREWAFGDATGARGQGGRRRQRHRRRPPGGRPGRRRASPSRPTPTARTAIRIVEGPHEDLFGHGTACAAIIRALAPGRRSSTASGCSGRTSRAGAVFLAGIGGPSTTAWTWST